MKNAHVNAKVAQTVAMSHKVKENYINTSPINI